MEITHRLINGMFPDNIDRVIVEMLAVQRHTNILHAVIDKREISSLYAEAVARLSKIEKIVDRNLKHQIKYRNYYSRI
jgi:hypothetical protein